VTCDLGGSIDFLTRYTTIDHPFFMYNPQTAEYFTELNRFSTGIFYHAVDHLPAELAWDATTHFGMQLLPLLENLSMSDITKPLEEADLMPEL